MIYYCILPGGNQDEFSEIHETLKRRKVQAAFVDIKDNPDDRDIYNTECYTRVYRISREEAEKLPKDDNNEPFLGGEDSGHDIKPLSEKALMKLVGPSPWWKNV